ncbi:MAG TPA: D-alanyl-D-alanine carboxypeptidase/D-alanyl-D-alanine-endopeptidase [Burkholderiales bacterium]|nr:D-alanyl-D-alanine carboxypeptidase/D-alanyl-D-alanine-endopeptidase [Burkholderiales bacterium]
MRATVLALFFLSLTVPAAAERLPVSLSRSLKSAGLDEAHVGIYVQQVNVKTPLLAYGADSPFNPASTMKLLTTYAALELLGPAFTWRTEFYALGTIEGGLLNGDLIIKGYGNPKLTLENFWLMLRELRQRGVREIRGNLVLDRGYFFTASNTDPGQFDNEPYRPYNVSPDALLLNFNSIRLLFIPDSQNGTIRVVVDPLSEDIEIVNDMRLVDAPCGDWSPKLVTDIQITAKSALITLNGAYPTGCGEQTWYVALFEHSKFVYEVFKELWGELGGKLNGDVRELETPAQARFLFSGESVALGEVVRDINKWSNNVMARQLFLTIGAEALQAPATAEQSAQAIKQFLAKKGLVFPELVLENGAGLSRSERISAKHLGMLLSKAYQSPVMPELVASLPLIAVDGTMKKRLYYEDVAGMGHIKTGSLEGVRAIAGYLLDHKGRMMVVVCLINSPRAADAEQFEDALLQWVYRR